MGPERPGRKDRYVCPSEAGKPACLIYRSENRLHEPLQPSFHGPHKAPDGEGMPPIVKVLKVTISDIHHRQPPIKFFAAKAAKTPSKEKKTIWAKNPVHVFQKEFSIPNLPTLL
jgi:hypothetical protein